MKLADWYYANLGKLLIVPILITLISIGVLFVTFQNTGDIILKDVSLTGGVAARVEIPADVALVESTLESSLSEEVIVRRLSEFGSDEQVGFTVEVGGEVTAEQLEVVLRDELGLALSEENYSVEQTGSSLGQSFYRQMVGAVLFAFLLMAIVVFITFRSFIPSVAVVAAAFFDLIATIAVLNIIGVQVSTAGIAALLLLIGYSIDTDILLTTRVLKHEGVLKEKIFSSIKTGMTMTLTTMVALVAGLIFSNAAVIREMFLIVLIGLVLDVISTWVTNVFLIRWYVGRKS